jgi:pimeloyl-ACP methyl ester carboxylesterase
MMNEVLIILPGWGGSKETWQKFINLAKEDFFDVICIDLPCFGKESCPSYVWGVKEYASFVNDAIKKLQIIQNKKIALLGHSFGGQIAVQFAYDFPNVASRIILSAPAVVRPKKYIKKVFFLIISKIGNYFFNLPVLNKFQTVARIFLYKLAGSPDYLNTSDIKREIFKKITQQDLSSILPNINSQVLIVWGSKDRYISCSYGKIIKKLILNSKLVILNGEGHGMHINCPQKFLNAILQQ